MQTLHPCHHGYFVHKLIEQTLGGWGKMLTDKHRTCHIVHLIIENLFSSHFLVSFYMGHKYLHTLYLFQEIHPHTPSPDFLITNLTILFFLSP